MGGILPALAQDNGVHTESIPPQYSAGNNTGKWEWGEAAAEYPPTRQRRLHNIFLTIQHEVRGRAQHRRCGRRGGRSTAVPGGSGSAAATGSDPAGAAAAAAAAARRTDEMQRLCRAARRRGVSPERGRDRGT